MSNLLNPQRNRTLIIYTDSKLLINSLTLWRDNWIKNNWVKNDEFKTPIQNVDLLKLLYVELQNRKTIFKHVKAHTGKCDFESYWNNEVDKLAQKNS